MGKATRRFPVRFKLAIGFLAIITVLAGLITSNLILLDNIRRRSDALFEVYEMAVISLGQVRTSLYTANLRCTQYAFSLTEKRLEIDPKGLGYQLDSDLFNAGANFANFQKTYSTEFQSPTARQQVEQYQANYLVWRELMGKLKDRLGDAPAYGAAFLDPRLGARFDLLSTGIDILLDELRAASQAAHETIRGASTQALLFYFFGGLLTALLTVLVLVLQDRSLVRPIKGLALRMHEIVDGEADLTVTLKSGNRDEIGDICRDFNGFMARLDATVGLIRQTMGQTSGVAAGMQGNTVEVSTSLTEIDSNNQQISLSMNELDTLLSQAGESAGRLGDALASLGGQIGDQNLAIGDSAGAVQSMISDIGTVAGISRKNREESDGLRDSSVQGRQRLDEAVASVEKINQSVSGILDMTRAIAAIAAQTNLLSMNAAIEAAHAGEAGAGFSVVAAEIRSLSANVSLQSKDINRELKAMVKEIENAWQKSLQTREAFSRIGDGVDSVIGALDGIIGHNLALDSQGGRVLEKMEHVRAMSARVQADMAQIGASSAEVQQVMARVRRLGTEVAGGIAEIAVGTKDITLVTQELRDINHRLVGLVDRAGEELAVFVLAADRSGTPC